MPLNTEIKRNGESLKLPWGDFHVAAMVCAAAWDSGKGPFVDGNVEPPTQSAPLTKAGKETGEFGPEGHYLHGVECFELASYHTIAATPLNEGRYTLKHNYTFVDCKDMEVLHLRAGDELVAFRN